MPKPLVIATPVEESQIQATVYCAKEHGLQIRVRSVGHDFEGLSCVSEIPFVLVDLENLLSNSVDAEYKTTWVQAGATIGELYYRIVEKLNSSLSCRGLSFGWHWWALQWGRIWLARCGLAADNILDALIMDDFGNIRDQKSMAEYLFWAFRGGAGASFGIILAWKIKLVDVPSIVSVLKVDRILEQNATKIVHQWQYLAHKLPDKLLVEAGIMAMSSNSSF